MKTLPAVDAVIVGAGWTGLLMAKELGSRTGLRIAVLERGAARKATDYFDNMDELDYAIRLRMMQDLSRETVTIRHHGRMRALPMRQYGSFLPGTGVGGAGEHWSGISLRMFPDCFELHTRTVERYGAERLPQNHSIQDWGITYDELEPWYVKAERLMGISGAAGANPFEGRRSAPFPTPPTKIPYFAKLFADAARGFGLHPYPIPAATTSTTYRNPDGIVRAGCVYCGYCERFGCMVGAKAQPTNTLLPLVAKQRDTEIRTGASVRRVLHQDGRATGVTYVDTKGEEYFQPAGLVFLASWTLNNTRLLLLSKIGDAYDPATGKGTLGRNLTHQVHLSAATVFCEKPLNRFIGAGAAGMMLSDYDGDVFDHADAPFLRGGNLVAVCYGYRPIGTFGIVPPSVQARWGPEWKKAAAYWYDRTGRINFYGEHLAYRSNYMDLDPVYTDQHGDPLLRMTIDWQENERRMTAFGVAKAVEIARAMPAREIAPFGDLKSYDTTRYQSTHVQGGAIMGLSPETSVVNPWLQHWKVPNLYVLGASAFPQNPSCNPTLTILAQTYRTADAIVSKKL